MKLIDKGFIIEAQELEVYKSDTSDIGTEFYSGDEKFSDQSLKIAEYEKLLNQGKREHNLTYDFKCLIALVFKQSLQATCTIPRVRNSFVHRLSTQLSG